MAAVGLEVADVGAARVEGCGTVGTEGLLLRRALLPIGGSSVKGEILEHLGAHAVETEVQFGFDLTQGGSRMLQAPLMHPGDDVGTQLMPGIVEGIAVHNTSLWYLRRMCAWYLMVQGAELCAER